MSKHSAARARPLATAGRSDSGAALRGGRRKPAQSPAPPRRSRSTVAASIALVAVSAWAYATSFAGVFVYDDRPAIIENPHIRTLWPLTRAMSAPPEVTVSGRPVASLTLALNYALAPVEARDVMSPTDPGPPAAVRERFYRNIRGYHLLNLLIHASAGLVLFGVVRRSILFGLAHSVASRTVERYRAHATAIAFIAALIWLVHPLHTQAVTYIVQRVESLMGLFYLLTLYCAIRAAETSLGVNRHAWWTLGAITACALGMATKEVMVAAPILVWLWDWVFRVERRVRRPLYAGLAATWLILAILVASETRAQSVGFHHGWTWWSYLQTQAAVIVHYLRLALVPSPLVFDYNWRAAGSFAEIAPQAALLIALAAVTVLGLVRRHPFAFLGAWFFLILAPTSSVLPITTEVAAEHRMYLPLAAVIVAVVVGAYRVASIRAVREPPLLIAGKPPLLIAGLILAGAVAVCFAQLTRERNRDYWSDEALWLDTVQKRPTNARARVAYSSNLLTFRRYAEAEAQLRAAIAIDEADAYAHMNLGSALCAQRKLDEGIQHLERALALDPRLKEPYGLLGEAYATKGDEITSSKYFLRAVEVLPDNPFLLNRVAWLLTTSANGSIRNAGQAVDLAERAVGLTRGEDVLSLETLAAAYAAQSRFGDAVDALRRAVTAARPQGNPDTIAALERRLREYEARVR